MAREPRLTARKREVEMVTRTLVIMWIEGSSLPTAFTAKKARRKEEKASRTGSRKAGEGLGNGGRG